MKPQHIYVVIGSTGEYSDHREWPVCWRPTLEEAQAMVKALDEQAAEYKRRSNSEEWGWGDNEAEQAFRKEMLDGCFACDYTGTTYHVWTVSDDPMEVPR